MNPAHIALILAAVVIGSAIAVAIGELLVWFANGGDK